MSIKGGIKMLKFKLFAVAAVAMLAFTGCGSSAPKADASSAVESAAKEASSAAESAGKEISSAAESAAKEASSAVESAKDKSANESSSESGAETTVEYTTAK